MKYFPLDNKQKLFSVYLSEQTRQGCSVTKFVPDQLRLLEGPAGIDSVMCELMSVME